MNELVIAIDGPAGAGKSTVAKKIAKKLNIEYIDTGAMYRALTLKAIEKNIDIDNKKEIINLLKSTSISFESNSIYLDGIKIDNKIRENIINNNVSNIAKIKEVRDTMVEIQQKLSKTKNVIMDGRDIGTVVLPNANYKFFVTASVEERAKRRYEELMIKNEKKITYEQILKEIEKRDTIDSTRKVSPLKKSVDSYVIDTTYKSIEESVDTIILIIKGGN